MLKIFKYLYENNLEVTAYCANYFLIFMDEDIVFRCLNDNTLCKGAREFFSKYNTYGYTEHNIPGWFYDFNPENYKRGVGRVYGPGRDELGRRIKDLEM